jgi:hypothetical protein
LLASFFNIFLSIAWTTEILGLKQPAILALRGEKRVVRPFLGNSPFIHDDDLIRVLNSRQLVRDHHCCPSSRSRFKGILHCPFGF